MAKIKPLSIKVWRAIAAGAHPIDLNKVCICEKCAREYREAAQKQVDTYDKFHLLIKNAAKFRRYLSGPKNLPECTMICLHGDLQNVRVVYKGTITRTLWGREIENDFNEVYNVWCKKHDRDLVLNAEGLLEELAPITEFDEIHMLLTRLVNGK